MSGRCERIRAASAGITTEMGMVRPATTATSRPARAPDTPACSRKKSANQPNATYACSDCVPKKIANAQAVELRRIDRRTRWTPPAAAR